MGSYSSLAVRDAQGNITGYVSTSTGGMVEVAGAASPSFQQQLALANAQKYLSVGTQGSYQQSIQYVPDQYIDTRSAAGIAQLVGRGGGAVDIGVAQRALGEGLSPSQINVAGVGMGGQRINVPVSDVISGASPIVGVESGRGSLFQTSQPVTQQLPAPYISQSRPAAIAPQQPVQSSDWLAMLGLGGSSLGKTVFQNVTQGQLPASPDFSGRIVGGKTVASQATLIPVTKSGGLDIGSPFVPTPEQAIGSKSTVTAYVPYGEYRQTELQNVKLAIEPITGELAIYQQAGTGRNIYNLVGGGGRAALQSGMFSVESPLTPAVFTQESGGVKYAATANIPAAEKVLASPQLYSRLGAEAYGGIVTPLDSRVLSPESKVSTYPSAYNLASYVSPAGANLGKAEAPGAAIPWAISSEAPAISTMGPRGIAGQVTSPQTMKPVESLPTPYISTTKPYASKESSVFSLPSDVSGIVKSIQQTAPPSQETTSTEKQFLTGLYGSVMEQPVVSGVSQFVGKVPSIIGGSVSFAVAKPELTPLGFVGGEGYVAEGKYLIPAAGAVVAGLVLSAGERTGFDLTSAPGVQKAQELWEGVGAPIQTPGAFNLPKITDVIPTSVYNAPGEGYRQIVNAPGQGYGLIVNLPGEGRNLIAKAGEAVPMPTFGGGITDVIQFPRSTIIPGDIITPAYDLTSKAEAKVTEVGRSLVTERPIFDLSTGTQAKETVATKEATVSQFAPDYATKLAAAAGAAIGMAVSTPFWWTETSYQSRVNEQNRLAYPSAYPSAYPTAYPTSIGMPFATPTAISQPIAVTYPTPYTPVTPNVPQITTQYPPDYISTPGPRPPQIPDTKLTPTIPIFPSFSGGGSYPGGMRRGRKPFAETFNIGLDISTFGSKAYNPFGGKAGGTARKRTAPKKKLTIRKRGKK